MCCQRKVRQNSGWKPEIELAKNYRYSRKQLKNIELLIEEHYHEIVSAWKEHFGD